MRTEEAHCDARDIEVSGYGVTTPTTLLSSTGHTAFHDEQNHQTTLAHDDVLMNGLTQAQF